MGSGQGPGEVSPKEAVKTFFDKTDFAKIERSMAKQASFIQLYGSGPQRLNNYGSFNYSGLGAYDPDLWKSYTCKYCDKTKGAHTRTQCLYRRTELRYLRLGYVPFRHHGGSKFRKHGVRAHRGSFGLFHTHRWRGDDMTPTKETYVPIWAAILFEESGLGGLCGKHRKKDKVRTFWKKIGHVVNHPDEELVILGEHILQGGKYSEVCQTYLALRK